MKRWRALGGEGGAPNIKNLKLGGFFGRKTADSRQAFAGSSRYVLPTAPQFGRCTRLHRCESKLLFVSRERSGPWPPARPLLKPTGGRSGSNLKTPRI